MALGYRSKDNVRTTDISLRFYVAKKRSLRQLQGDMIPSRLPLIQKDGRPHPTLHIETDIHETGRIRPAATPVSGDAIRVGNDTGTTGLVFPNADIGILLTAGHVLDPSGTGDENPIEISSHPPTLGHKPVVLPLRRRDASITTPSSNLDAGICQVDGPIGSLHVHDGEPITALQDPEYDARYRMYSRKLQKEVEATGADLEAVIKIDRLGPNDDWLYVTDAFVLSIEAEQGDSGSLVYRPLPQGSVAAVGILVAVTDDGHAIFHKLRSVLGAFKTIDGIDLHLGVPGDIA